MLRLAVDDKHQFQQWACWKVGGFPRDKKGGDKGVDGWFNYEWVDLDHDNKRSIGTGVISVKGGEHLNPGMVRDLGRVMERDRHAFGLFIVAARPTKGVRDEIASHPLIETQWGRVPAMQVVTIAELIHGPAPKLPSPLKGERIRRLASLLASRSWRGVLWAARTPLQASLTRCAGKLRYPLPFQGRGQLVQKLAPPRMSCNVGFRLLG